MIEDPDNPFVPSISPNDVMFITAHEAYQSAHRAGFSWEQAFIMSLEFFKAQLQASVDAVVLGSVTEESDDDGKD